MSRGNHIENEAAYYDAIERNIRNNARRTRSAKWLATEGGKRANAFLFELDEFEYTFLADGTCFTHPVVKACLGDFFTKMHDSVNEWGGLTDGQTNEVGGLLVDVTSIVGYHLRLAKRPGGGDAKLVPGGQDGGFDSGLPCVDGPRALGGLGKIDETGSADNAAFPADQAGAGLSGGGALSAVAGHQEQRFRRSGADPAGFVWRSGADDHHQVRPAARAHQPVSERA